MDGGKNGNVKPEEVSLGLQVSMAIWTSVLEEVVSAEFEGSTSGTPHFAQMSPVFCPLLFLRTLCSWSLQVRGLVDFNYLHQFQFFSLNL